MAPIVAALTDQLESVTLAEYAASLDLEPSVLHEPTNDGPR
jgi:hypothetical protein